MNVNSELIKSYTKICRVKSILQTPSPKNVFKKMNFNTISVNTKRLERLEKDAFQKSTGDVWQDVGKVKLENRLTGELVDVTIKRRNPLSKHFEVIAIQLVHNDKPLIEACCSSPLSSQKKFGLEVLEYSKHEGGENFKGLGKTIDVIAVKESLNSGYMGKVQLGTGSAEPFHSAEPLHWARGFKRLEYFTQNSKPEQNKYDADMKQLFNTYQKARTQGKSINQAKAVMSSTILPSEHMVLSEDLVAQYVKQSKKIRYS